MQSITTGRGRPKGMTCLGLSFDLPITLHHLLKECGVFVTHVAGKIEGGTLANFLFIEALSLVAFRISLGSGPLLGGDGNED